MKTNWFYLHKHLTNNQLTNCKNIFYQWFFSRRRFRALLFSPKSAEHVTPTPFMTDLSRPRRVHLVRISKKYKWSGMQSLVATSAFAFELRKDKGGGGGISTCPTFGRELTTGLAAPAGWAWGQIPPFHWFSWTIPDRPRHRHESWHSFNTSTCYLQNNAEISSICLGVINDFVTSLQPKFFSA